MSNWKMQLKQRLTELKDDLFKKWVIFAMWYVKFKEKPYIRFVLKFITYTIKIAIPILIKKILDFLFDEFD